MQYVSDFEIFNSPDGLRRFEQEVAETGQLLRGTLHADVEYHGSDSSDSVRVTLDGTTHVRNVTIAPTWSRKIGVEQLGDALLEAYAIATSKTYRDIEMSMAKAGLVDFTIDNPTSTTSGTARPALTVEDEGPGEPDTEPMVIYGRGRMLCITIQSGQILAIQSLRDSLSSVPVHRLSQEAMSVFLAAEQAMRGE